MFRKEDGGLCEALCNDNLEDLNGELHVWPVVSAADAALFTLGCSWMKAEASHAPECHAPAEGDKAVVVQCAGLWLTIASCSDTV